MAVFSDQFSVIGRIRALRKDDQPLHARISAECQDSLQTLPLVGRTSPVRTSRHVPDSPDLAQLKYPGKIFVLRAGGKSPDGIRKISLPDLRVRACQQDREGSRNISKGFLGKKARFPCNKDLIHIDTCVIRSYSSGMSPTWPEI